MSQTYRHVGAAAAAIVDRVATESGLAVDDLCGPSRERSIAWPRQRAMHELRTTGRYSLGQIGYLLGGRDHTTVLAGLQAHAKRLAEGIKDQPVPMRRHKHDLSPETRSQIAMARKSMAEGASLSEAALLIGWAPDALDRALWNDIGRARR